jgi:hypothetical protein
MNLEPTHDADRDISRGVRAEASYDLASADPLDVIATNPMRRAGHGAAVRENPDNIGSGGNALVIARSGNQSWDEDLYDAVGGVEDETPDIPCLGEDRSGYDPGMPVAKAVVIGAVAVGIYLWLTRNR